MPLSSPGWDTKAVVFDFGGTIDTDGVHWSEKFWELYERYEIRVAKKEFERAFVRADEELMGEDCSKDTFYGILHKQLLKQFAILKLEQSEIILDVMMNSCYQDALGTVQKAKLTLRELAPHYSLGVVSNFYGNLDNVCRDFGLEELFDAVIDSTVVGVRKPDPEIFSMALRRLNVDPRHSFVVGDSYDRDMVPSKKLGCTTVWLRGKSWTQPSSTDAADYTIHRFEEVKEILL